MEISLTQNQTAIIDKKDWPTVSQHKWYAVRFPNSYYVATKINGNRVMLHNFLVGKKLIDHKNRNGLDNRRVNLRKATGSQNCGNAVGKGGKSKYKGIYPYRDGRWGARICVDGKRHFLGYHDSEVEAASVYDVAAIKYFGEFARPNFKGGNLD